MTEELVQVRLYGIPVPLVRRAREHWDSLIRELAIIALDEDVDRRSHLPKRLSQVARQLGRENATLLARDVEAIDRATQQGVDAIDLEYDVPRSAGQICQMLDELVEEADQFCRREKLLTPAAPDDVAAYRRWLYGEFIRQCAGAEPTPWPAAHQTHPSG